MASQPITGEVYSLPFVPPMPAVARILSRFDRQQVEGFIAVALELLDTLDGDPDAEEPELEDAFVKHDPAFAYLEPEAGDCAWVEWTTLRPAQRRGPNIICGHEDDEEDDAAEDDDPGGGNVEDEGERDDGY